jgi:hypothetical protein
VSIKEEKQQAYGATRGCIYLEVRSSSVKLSGEIGKQMGGIIVGHFFSGKVFALYLYKKKLILSSTSAFFRLVNLLLGVVVVVVVLVVATAARWPLKSNEKKVL